MRYFVFTLLFLSAQNLLFGQFNPDAGLVIPFSANAHISTSSGSNAAYINDRKTKTYWESSNPLPSGYIGRKDLNCFLNRDEWHISQNSIDNIIDGDLDTKATITQPVITFEPSKPQYIYLLSIKFQTEDSITLILRFKNESIKTFQLHSSSNFHLQKILVNAKVVKLTIWSKKTYNIFELAGLYAHPEEFVLIDLGEPKPVGQLYIRALNDAKVEKIEVLGGNNKNKLTHLLYLKPTAIPLIPYLIEPEMNIRYLKVIFHLPIDDYYKVKLWEFDIYDRFGPYGAPKKAKKSTQTYDESFGINAFWGWGYNVYSNLIPKNRGPWEFSQICSLARNYHRLDWDIKNPGQSPDYVNMASGNGTKVNPWLNWDKEYEQWEKAGFKIDATLLFNNDLFPDTLWDNSYQESYDLGREFTTYFVKKNKLINQIEVGNEPWGYQPKTYQEILAGFADGSRTVSNVTILPCAAQAYNPHHDANNYIELYLNNKAVNKIDGLNTHIYNYIFDSNGNYVAINPEDPRAEIWSINNLQRYLNRNMPGKGIYVTEFGYDSDGGGETCTHSVCVPEKVQAIYGVRSAIIFQRLGVKQFYWYYFANVAYNSFLHNRSGLSSSSKAGFQEKISFYAFKLLYNELKDYSFDKVLSENSQLYAYLFTDKQNNKIVIAWIPTSTKHFEHNWITIPGNYVFESATPVVDDPETKIEGDSIYLSGIPVFLKIIGR